MTIVNNSLNQRLTSFSNDVSNSQYKKQLIINYLAPDVTQMDLIRLFMQFGSLDEAKVVRYKVTGASRGYGFVYFYNKDNALFAINAMNGYQYHGKRLKVSYSTNPISFVPPLRNSIHYQL
uniref:ELAV-like protein 2 n=1 Tax=Lygus hesperus TaxID=30085 RepID=A0A0A9XNZ1_LYGHE